MNKIPAKLTMIWLKKNRLTIIIIIIIITIIIIIIIKIPITSELNCEYYILIPS